MRRARLLAVFAIIGTAAALVGTVPASASARVGPGPASRSHGILRPARPPRPGTARSRRVSAALAGDTIGCYDQESILSAENLDWVSAELGYTGATYAMLRARATTIGPWEKFDLCYDYTNAYWYIISDANGLIVSAEFGYTGDNYAMLRARSSSVGPWEKFTLSCYILPVGPQTAFLVIRSQVNNDYATAELGYTGANYAMLRARSSTIGPWQEFLTATGRIGC